MEYPEKLEIELARGFCTASCPMCSIDETKYNKVVMKFEKFKAIVDSFGEHIDKINHVNLVGLGEVLLDKKLDEKIKYLKLKGVDHVSFPSNASLLDAATSKKILDAGLGEIIIGIDSMNKPIFEKVRRDLIFEEVLENTLSHIKVRDKYDYNSKIMIRMIINKDNSNEWNSYVKYWEKLLNFDKGDMILYFPEHNWSDHDYPNSEGKPKIVKKDIRCDYIYDRLCLDAHGNVKFCCIDINASFFGGIGNVLLMDPIEIFNSDYFVNSRRLMNEGEINKIKPCSTCNVPIQRSQRGYSNSIEFDVPQ